MYTEGIVYMRKVVMGISLLALTCIGLQIPALADPWFDNYDRDHSGYWNWEEYRAAQMDYCRHHHMRCDEARMRDEWAHMAHNDRAYPADAQGLHPW
jgi:hypothetical protein